MGVPANHPRRQVVEIGEVWELGSSRHSCKVWSYSAKFIKGKGNSEEEVRPAPTHQRVKVDQEVVPVHRGDVQEDLVSVSYTPQSLHDGHPNR